MEGSSFCAAWKRASAPRVSPLRFNSSPSRSSSLAFSLPRGDPGLARTDATEPGDAGAAEEEVTAEEEQGREA